MLIADVNRNAHTYAIDQVQFRQRIDNGQIKPLGTCDGPNCKNLAVPGQLSCAPHLENPLAT